MKQLPLRVFSAYIFPFSVRTCPFKPLQVVGDTEEAEVAKECYNFLELSCLAQAYRSANEDFHVYIVPVSSTGVNMNQSYGEASALIRDSNHCTFSR
jgi:hypothetical protein